MEMTPEERAYHFEQTTGMPRPDWSGMWTELYGHVSETAVMGELLDPAVLESYMRELKRRYVTDPVVAWIRNRADVT